MVKNFYNYRGYTLEYVAGYMYICHWFGCENPLICSDLQDAKNQIDKKLKKEHMKSNYPFPPMFNNSMLIIDECVSFADCPQPAMPCQTAACSKLNWKHPVEQKGNNPMYVDNDKHIESSKINYLTGRAEEALYASEDKINDAFNLRKPKAPETPEDLVTAITSGNYTIPPKTERNTYDRVVNQIVWRAPTVVADEAGAKVARDAFRTLFKSAKDAIMISTPAEALTAVQALDAWTPVAGTVAS